MELVRKKDRCELKVNPNTDNIQGVLDKKDNFPRKLSYSSLKKSPNVQTSKSIVKLGRNRLMSPEVKSDETASVSYASCGTQSGVSMIPTPYTEEQKLEDMFSDETSVSYILNQINRLEESYNSLLEESFGLDITIDELNDSIAEVTKEMEMAASIFNEAMMDEEESEADQ
uniref:Geminin (inferred by orthology to a human protein) n=1 Tax=Strongyloides venezuelensis TaxID=75913 RepID=A0A0K0EZ83_STRVS